jgi:hypothetical protein
MSDQIPLWRRGMSLQMQAEPGLLRAVVTGEFSPDEAERTFVDMLETAARRKLDKVLLDGREVRGEPDVLQRFLYGEFVALTVARHVIARGLTHKPQFAYVLLEPVLDPQRFAETVAVHRGMWVKAFDDIEEARAWLEADTPSDPGQGAA